MKITVITPCYNSVRYLDATLESIHAQKGDFELEHIVMDGGSTDGTVDILERWRDKLQYVSDPDKGQSDAINKGFAKATVEVLAWINGDDLYLPGALNRVAAVFRNDQNARWAYGRCKIIDEYGQEIRKPITWWKNLLLRRFSYTKLLFEDFISQPATFFRRDLLEQAGPLDESLNFTMDYDLWLRFGQICQPVVIDYDLAAFRFHKEAKTGGSYEDSFKEANTISRKYSQQVGKPWIGSLNYWLYYKRTSLIYRLLD